MWAYKTPDETRDITLNWQDELPAGVTIAASEFTTDPGLTITDTTALSPRTCVRVTGGAKNQRYKTVNTVTLDDGEIYQFAFTIICRERSTK